MLWFDGRLHPESIVPFDVADRGLMLGDGVFDTALVLAGTMVWREAHLARLQAACATLGFALDGLAVMRAVEALVAGVAQGALRITVTRGVGPRGIAPPQEPKPMIMASIVPLRPGFFAPLTLQVSDIRRNETSPKAQLKVLDYVDAMLASRAAKLAGFDDALFLNTRGRVACATIGNIMALKDARLLTPPLDDGVLPGVTRAALLRLCGEVGLEPVERSLTLDDLLAADAVYVTNSLKLMAPVTRVGARTIAAPDATDPLVAALCDAVRRETGIDPRLIRA